MKQLEAILTAINEEVDKYHQLQLKAVLDQSEILRNLTSNLYFLEQYRIEAHEKWLSVYHNSQAKSAAGKEREADNVVRELYLIRRVMTSGYRVVDSIRSTISIHKREG